MCGCQALLEGCTFYLLGDCLPVLLSAAICAGLNAQWLLILRHAGTNARHIGLAIRVLKR
ncbi:hypothetical protein AGR9A_Cc120141 [Agrobacterium salinitolerans str. Hayward 0363]|nr:hypothetical protein AGR9A_Cc120141 [Agrobacterium salinitolerans str. Hayward 0363]